MLILKPRLSSYFSHMMKRWLDKGSSAESSGPNSKTQKIAKFDVTWKNQGNLVKGVPPMMYLDGIGVEPSGKIASFDLDNTLVVTKSGKTFPTGPDDWKFESNKVVEKLQSLKNEGFKVVIFTNQAGLEKSKTKPEHLKTKFDKIMKTVGFPIQVFVATGENVYRKPCIEMWKFMAEKCNGDKIIDFDVSFYCGDAAGRPKNWAPGKVDIQICGILFLAWYFPSRHVLVQSQVKSLPS